MYAGPLFSKISFLSLDISDDHIGGGIRCAVYVDNTQRNLLDLKGYNGAQGQAEVIINEEGMGNRFIRHSKLANIARDWIGRGHQGFKLFPSCEVASDTVTCIQHPPELDKNSIKSQLREKGYLFDSGYKKLVAKGYHTFRIPTMGDMTEDILNAYLSHIDDIIKKDD